jgi:uncharacterized protein HemX
MDSFSSLILAIIGALTAAGSVVVLWIKSRGENKNAALNAKVALDKLIDDRVTRQLTEAYGRLDAQDTKIEEQDEKIRQLETRESRRTGAFLRILKAIANQWPAGTEGPNLDPLDIAEVEDTVPVAWIRRRPPK